MIGGLRVRVRKSHFERACEVARAVERGEFRLDEEADGDEPA
jgi:hypothetical protein